MLQLWGSKGLINRPLYTKTCKFCCRSKQGCIILHRTSFNSFWSNVATSEAMTPGSLGSISFCGCYLQETFRRKAGFLGAFDSFGEQKGIINLLEIYYMKGQMISFKKASDHTCTLKLVKSAYKYGLERRRLWVGQRRSPLSLCCSLLCEAGSHNFGKGKSWSSVR